LLRRISPGPAELATRAAKFGPDHVAEAEAELLLETPLQRLAQSGLQLDHPGEGEALEINGHRAIVQ
jgi:hypothetical protein